MFRAADHVQLSVDELNFPHVRHPDYGGERHHLLPAADSCPRCFLPFVVHESSLHLFCGLLFRAPRLTPPPHALDLDCSPFQSVLVVLGVIDVPPPQPRGNSPRVYHPTFSFGAPLEVRSAEIPCSQDSSVPLESHRQRLHCLLRFVAVCLLHLSVLLYDGHQPHLRSAEATLAPQSTRTTDTVAVVGPGHKAGVGEDVAAAVQPDVAHGVVDGAVGVVTIVVVIVVQGSHKLF
mmetsp:Transcript_73611/g.168745  ORF Transcript_73611/g.168745 Transcript_73611/m.168745 type:complete len:234 (-) Transcript_73611:455-1156(-)